MIRSVVLLALVACNGDQRPAAPVPSRPAPSRPAPAMAPGEPLELRVLVRSPDGKPLADAPVFLYQTDAAGYYKRNPDGTEAGGEHAQVTYRVRTDRDGRFTQRTILPGRYPTGGPPPHFHLHIPPEDTANDITIMLDHDPAFDRERIAKMARTFVGHVRVDGGTIICDAEIQTPR